MSIQDGNDVKCENVSYLLEKPILLRIVVGVACILSVLGSGVIVLSYYCSKEHRTRTRYILVHLSISNLGLVISNFIGTAANFDRTFNRTNTFSYDIRSANRSTVEQMCTAQAFFTIYFSVSGMLWTISLAVYLYLVILSMKQVYFTRYFVWLSYGLCYGLPFLIDLWLLLSNRLGYAPYSTPGYCGLMTRKPFPENQFKCRDIFGEFLGYDMWVILTIFLTLLFYMSALCYLKYQQKEHISNSENFWQTIQSIDHKFILIPLTIAFLRIWSLITNWLFMYNGFSGENEKGISMFFLMGIGNCIQGFIDAILFVAFTPLIRQKLMTAILCGRGILTSKQPNRFLKESKNYYDNHLKNYRPHPRYSLTSSSPITISPTRFSPSPEPSTSFYESPGSSFDAHGGASSIQSEEAVHNYTYY